MELSHLRNYIHLFTHLRTDASRQRWNFATHFHAPHKPFLLLSILDLFAQGSLQTNLIEISPELGAIFSKYWQILMPPDRRGNLALPFFHLKSSGFWHLLPIPGQEALLQAAHQVDTLAQLQRLVFGAKLDNDLYQLLQAHETRDVLRAALIQAYFAEEEQAAILQQGAVNFQSFVYSQALIQNVQRKVKESVDDETGYQPNVRDQGFRRAVVRVYDHRCAFCGVRMLTVDGHSAVEAAHIVPWSVNHNDDPRNGMALCRLCHWTFDEGLASVSSRYTMLLSQDLRTAHNLAGHLLALENRPIMGPADSVFQPDQEALNWHRHNIYRAA